MILVRKQFNQSGVAEAGVLSCSLFAGCGTEHDQLVMVVVDMTYVQSQGLRRGEERTDHTYSGTHMLTARKTHTHIHTPSNALEQAGTHILASKCIQAHI